MQYVFCCSVVWFEGRSRGALAALYIRKPATALLRAAPLQGRTMNSWFAVVVGM